VRGLICSCLCSLQVLHDAVESGKRIGAIFKEPTVTPTEVQKIKLGLKKTWGSPNGAMRRGWNGITISRDTIHIDGLQLGFKKPVLFERHAVGGEYQAGYKTVGAGTVETVFTGKDGKKLVVDSRDLHNADNAVVTYHNPLDNVTDLAHIFFARCLEAKIVPYVVTKKTVFKWQEGFWAKMKAVFDEHYYEDFKKAGILDKCGGELQHLISDAATMQIIRWTGGGFGMAAHNYDGDMLTDEIAQIHRSPGFITSNLVGKNDDGTLIKEFEASHGTVADMWEAHLQGKETSLNPLGLVEALIGAVDHSVDLAGGPDDLKAFTAKIRSSIHTCFTNGLGTRDLCGPSGLTTEQFVDAVGMMLEGKTLTDVTAKYKPASEKVDKDDVAMQDLDDVIASATLPQHIQS
jgi:isocitrate dehydrogenase